MISIRYHIVSVVAVFLALGLGILLGSSVVSTPIQAQLNANLDKVREERDIAKRDVASQRDENETLIRRIGTEIAPWALQGRLAGRTVIVLVDGPRAPSWREHVLDAVAAAGGTSDGTLLLGDRLGFRASGDRDELIRTVQSVVPSFVTTPTGDAAADALKLLGARLTEPTGRALIAALVQANFMSIQGGQDTDWPPADASIVMLSPSRVKDATMTGAAADFATSVAKVAPILVASDSADATSVLTVLRGARGLPKTLATFDASTNELDPGGIGVVAALTAATESRGGHFGAQQGRTFIAPPGPSPSPTP